MRRPVPTAVPGGSPTVNEWLREWTEDRAALEAAEDGMRQFVERAAKERTRAEAAEAKLAEVERERDGCIRVLRLEHGVALARVEAAEAKLAEAERERDDPLDLMTVHVEHGVRSVHESCKARVEALEKALLVVLDHIDYTRSACGPTEMVAGVLPVNVIGLARAALAGKEGP